MRLCELSLSLVCLPIIVECESTIHYQVDIDSICDWESNVECNIQPPEITTTASSKETQSDMTPTSSTTESMHCSNNQEYVRVCYYSNWAYWRQGSGKFTVADIDLEVCTHLVYAFAILDPLSLTIKAHDTWLDLPSGLNNFNAFTSLKNEKPGLKTLLAIGGWTDSRSSKYSTLVSSSLSRSNFINHVIPFLKQYNFDGLDLDWEYPGDATYGNPADKENFGLFVQELKNAFLSEGLLLTAAVGATEAKAEVGYDIPMLSQYLDLIHLMTYDFHGSWENFADHHSKLYNDASNFDADYAVSLWINRGAPPRKLVLGIPIYGRSFTLSTSQTQPPAPSSGGGSGGSITQEAGYLSYLEICTYINNGWIVVQDNSGNMGPYAYHGNQWVGYDDVDMTGKKAQYVKSHGMGGIMVWAIDLADFSGTCSQRRYPLLNALTFELSRTTNCTSTRNPTTTTEETSVKASTTSITTEQQTASPETSTSLTTTTTTTTTTTDNSICNEQFVCPSNGLWADPCSCKSYYNCFSGTPYHYTCAGETLWNPAMRYCDWEVNVECSTGSPPTTQKPPTTIEPPCAHQFVCYEDGSWADPCDCQRFYQCANGTAYHQSCPDETLWFQNQQNCNWADASQCSTTSIPNCNGVASYICSPQSNAIQMVCSDGNTGSFECPMNLVWSSDQMDCIPFSDPKAGC